MKNAWFEEIKKDIPARLEDYEGTTRYVCDMGFMLTEGENVNGSWYCSRKAAQDEISQQMDEFGAIAEYMRQEWGDTTNPLLECELFHCKAMICVYESAFNAAVADFEEWNEQAEITPEFIARVREALEEIDFDDLF